MDPTYPLVPVVSFIAAFLMLLTIILIGIRKTWNAGVLMLCIWLFLEDLIQGFEAILWSDNADIKAPVWCDISSRFDVAVRVAIPACSLVITRRLCNIACMRTIEAPSQRERHIRFVQDIFIGVGFPIIVMGPFYYVVQVSRFEILEEFGCGSATSMSGLTLILIDVWLVVFPLISAIFYCPRIVWAFYRQSRDVDAFLCINGSVNRTRYFRLLAVGCLDILFTLPGGSLIFLGYVGQEVKFRGHKGWHDLHYDHWAPISVPAAQWRSYFWERLEVLIQEWVCPVLSILIFAVFGLTAEARTRYRRWFCTAAGLFGFKPPVREVLPGITFNSPPRRRARSPGHSLSMPESSVVDEADFALSVPSTPSRDEGDSEGEVVEIIAREDHGRVKNDSVDAPPGTQQPRDADEAERDVEKEKLEV